MASIRTLPSGRINVQIRTKNRKPKSRTFDTIDQAQEWVSKVESDADEQPYLSFLELGNQYCDTVLRGKSSRSISSAGELQQSRRLCELCCSFTFLP